MIKRFLLQEDQQSLLITVSSALPTHLISWGYFQNLASRLDNNLSSPDCWWDLRHDISSTLICANLLFPELIWFLTVNVMGFERECSSRNKTSGAKWDLFVRISCVYFCKSKYWAVPSTIFKQERNKKISDVLNTDLRPWKRKLIGRLSTQFTWSSSYQCVGSEQTTTELTSSTRLVIGEGGTVSAPWCIWCAHSSVSA